MARIVFDKAGEHLYETGVDHGVHYLQDENGTYPKGVAWNGLTTVTESPSGAEATAVWADNIKYLSLTSAEEFGATVEAYTFPPEFAVCDGSAEPTDGVSIGQQDRKSFGMCYRTKLGNDINGDSHGYKLHMIYGAKATPSEKSYTTTNDSPEATTMSWTLSTTPVNVTGYKPTASLVVDSTKVSKEKLAALEEILYGKDAEGDTGTGTDPRLPLPDEIIALLKDTTGS